MNLKVCPKLAFFQQVPLAQHPARQHCFVGAVKALILARNVQLPQIAKHFNEQRSAEANERRLQAFLTSFPFDYERIALLMTLFIPRGQITLCLDRTEWKFGTCEVNILMLTARCGEVGIPLFWELLDNKSGNSSVADRTQLLEQAISLLGLERIGLLVADREFVGAGWVRYLVETNVPFCLRLPRTHPIRIRNGDVWPVEDLLQSKPERFYERVLVDGQWLNVHLKRLTGNDLLYLAGTYPPRQLGELYRRRWSIETMFQSFKERGFHLETTHLKALDKLKKLLGLVSLAYGFCVVAGHHVHRKGRRIKVKKHGYKANSYFRRGKDWLEAWLSSKLTGRAAFWEAALERAHRWLRYQIAYFYPKLSIFR